MRFTCSEDRCYQYRLWEVQYNYWRPNQGLGNKTFTSHKLIVLSRLAVASVLPSGENATQVIAAEWRLTVVMI